MTDKKDEVSDVLKGLKPVDPKSLEKFQRKMTKKIIPEIVKAVEERRVLAAESRRQQLKC